MGTKRMLRGRQKGRQPRLCSRRQSRTSGRSIAADDSESGSEPKNARETTEQRARALDAQAIVHCGEGEGEPRRVQRK